MPDDRSYLLITTIKHRHRSRRSIQNPHLEAWPINGSGDRIQVVVTVCSTTTLFNFKFRHFYFEICITKSKREEESCSSNGLWRAIEIDDFKSIRCNSIPYRWKDFIRFNKHFKWFQINTIDRTVRMLDLQVKNVFMLYKSSHKPSKWYDGIVMVNQLIKLRSHRLTACKLQANLTKNLTKSMEIMKLWNCVHKTRKKSVWGYPFWFRP